MHEDFVEIKTDKELQERLDNPDSEPLVGGEADQCSIRPLELRDKDVVKAICVESFPIQYPDFWFEELLDKDLIRLSGELFNFGIMYEGTIVAIIVAERKLLSHCSAEVCTSLLLDF